VVDSLGLQSGSISGYIDVGALVGFNNGSISSSYATLPVSGGAEIGGLVGYNMGSISTSYATGSVNGSGYYVGGLVGVNGNILSTSYAAGTVSGSGDVGGLVGENDGTISTSYWDNANTTTGVGVNNGTSSATGLADADMRLAFNFNSFDFDWTWYMSGNGYPQLQAFHSVHPQGNLIATLDNLRWLSLNSGYWGQIFQQTADIDASTTSSWDNGAGFSPIGNATTSFKGTYHGNGHTISGLTINRPTTDYVGLFGYVDDRTFDRIGLVGGSVTGHDYVGALVGFLYAGYINDSYTTGSVSGYKYVGGLVGKNFGRIGTSYATGSVSGNITIGGLVGHNENDINQSYATGSVSGNGLVGGLVGFNFRSVRESYATGSVSGSSDVGGLVGGNGGSISTSYWDLDKRTTGVGSNIGTTSATGLTDAQLRVTSNFVGFDFDGTWYMPANGYPLLQGVLIGRPAGNGTVYQPFQIATLDNLNWLSQNTSAWEKNFQQIADIDASTTSSWNSGTGFSPIGNATMPFNGSYHGQGHIITGLTINRPSIAYQGLFGYTGSRSLVDSLGLEGGSVSGYSYVGNLVGANDGSIITSYATGRVVGNTVVGGLVGVNNTGIIKMSYATGSVSSTGLYVGGLIGSNNGEVSMSYATGSVSSTGFYVGGLIGSNDGEVSMSYATGDVSSTYFDVGGLVGENRGNISMSYATGSVSGSSIVGGLVGGSEFNATISASYWNTANTTTGVGVNSGTASIIGLTDDDMHRQVSFPGFDFVNTWILYPGHSAPLLRAFLKPLTVTANNDTKTYDGVAFTGGNGASYSPVNVDGSLLLGTLHFDGASQGAIDVNSYAIVPDSLYSTQQGYAITFVPGTLTVTSRGIAVVADMQSKIYGDADPAFTYKVTSGSLASGDAFTGLLARDSGSNVGYYAINQGTLALSSNYALSFHGNLLAISYRAIRVTADKQSKMYGNADPTFTYKVTSGSLASGDAFTGLLARDSGSNVGYYAIHQGTLALNSNYLISFTGSHLAITPRMLSVVADAKTKNTTDEDPAFTYTMSNWANTDDSSSVLSGALNRVAGDTAGTYAILGNNLVANANYTIAYTGALLTILTPPVRELVKPTLVHTVAELHKDQPLELITLDGRHIQFANYVAAVTALTKGMYVLRQNGLSIVVRIR